MHTGDRGGLGINGGREDGRGGGQRAIEGEGGGRAGVRVRVRIRA